MSLLRFLHELLHGGQDGARLHGFEFRNELSVHEVQKVLFDRAGVRLRRVARQDLRDGAVDDFRNDFRLNLGNDERIGAFESHFERLAEESADDVKKLVFDLATGPAWKNGSDLLPTVEMERVKSEQRLVLLGSPLPAFFLGAEVVAPPF